MPGQKFENGQDVMGRWPGSSLYYEVKVVSFDVPSQLYTVRYKNDGTVFKLKEADMKHLNVFRNKKRSSVSPSRRRSRSRSRSPARRSKSPSRTPKSDNQLPNLQSELRKEVLKVQLTPLRLNDYNIGKHNGDPTRNEPNVLHHRVTRAKVNEVNEKILRYSPIRKKEDIVMKKTVDIVEQKPTEKPVEKPVERPVEKPDLKTLVMPHVKPVVICSKQLEFGGSIGAAFMILSMPTTLFYLLNMCLQHDAENFLSEFQFTTLWDPTTMGFFVLWLSVQALLYILPLGKIAVGLPLANEKKLQYRLNGFWALLLSSVIVGVMIYYKINFVYVYDHYLQFAASGTIISVLLSIYLYARSHRAPKEDLSPAGNAGNFIYHFFMGRELNPHIGSFDLKYFFALRPGLIAWVLINGIMLLAEMRVQENDVPSVPMILVNSFQLLYVAHALWNEEGAVTCMDIVHDGFGFMLAFGNLVWVPFIYSLQAFYLVNHSVVLSWPAAGAIVALNTLGYIIFRGANKQKHSFKKNPDDPRLAHLRTIPTSAGKNLLVSGWWGFVRHPNYLGDIIMAWAWCLPCGFDHFLPYFYGIFLTGLLIHRTIRDEQLCKTKYGADWESYCQRVPYRIVKYIY
ncbi:lamin-B receptor isoform X1 [Pelobates cultripes]|uniref:Delta(14)-sterol reductase LBR n=1 Tax=Pelobates cultripes TaxID=61616 RepID=A0AAD1RKC3_PELCU|nr:lamin-B receptor isoform X1 [Pelobates cultripes]